MSSLASAKMLSLVICAAVGSVMAGVSQCGTVKSVRYPWIYLGDFNEWLVRADLIVSGTIASTVRRKTRFVDGVEATANQAKINVDRIFMGKVKAKTVQFLWFSPAPVSGGVIYSGPPLAAFKPGSRSVAEF